MNSESVKISRKFWKPTNAIVDTLTSYKDRRPITPMATRKKEKNPMAGSNKIARLNMFVVFLPFEKRGASRPAPR